MEQGKPSSSSLVSDRGGASVETASSSSAAADVQQLLTLDLSRLCSRINLSPKEHRTELSLSVADLTVQRVKHHQQQHQRHRTTESPAENCGDGAASADGKRKTAEKSPLDTDELGFFGSDEFDESLFYGFQQKNVQSTHLLLAIGRTYGENYAKEANGKQKRSKRSNLRQKGQQIGRRSAHSPSSSTAAAAKPTDYGHQAEDNNAILRLFYKRLAPKLEVYHELNISCAPLSILCDECALSGIFEPFTQKVQERFDQKQQPYVQEHSELGSSPTDAITHQLFASVSIPELLVQLGSQKASQGYLMNPKIGHIEPSTSSTQSESDQSVTSSFVRSSVRSLQISYSRIDSQRISKWELDFDDVLIWLLEKGNRIKTTPFLRLNIRDLNVKSASSRVKAFLNLTIDYYRLRTLPGWEPLLEQCNKFGIDVDFTDSKQTNILLKPATGDTLEFTLTQLFIERALDFVAHSNSLQQIMFASDQADGLDRLRHLFHQQRQNAPGNIKVYDHHHPYETDLESGLTSDFDVQLELADGFAISLVGIVDEEGESKGLKQEELCYGRLSGIQLNVGKFKATYRINCHIDSIQMDNQIIGADRWHFLFCDPGALKDEPMVGLPALAFEMSYTPSEFFDVYECFRLKLSNACILLDEQLLWRLVHFWRCVLKRWQDQSDQQQRENVTTPTADETKCGTESPSFLHNNCYFGTLQLEFGNISLSVLTVDKSALSLSIRQLKDSFSEQITLFSFENALVTLAPFCWLRYFCSLSRLLDTLGNFYLNELKRQKLNIIFAMDAFGNPMALGNELKEGLQGLIFEGDLAGFAFGIGYGAANSLSKVTSSMAQGVGSLTFDEKHEELRRQMRRAKPEQSGPLTHLYGGIKGLGVGVFGGLTAIVKNTVTATQENGLISGIARGVTTGAIDTLTKPLQGTLDLLEGTASAVKEMVGAPLVRRAHFPDRRLRPSRVCSSLSGLLPAYSVEKAEAQLELMRITGTYALNDQNRLLAVVPFLVRTNFNGARVVQRALISLVQCCIVRQVDSQPSMVTYRILFQHFDIVRLVPNENQQQNDKGGGAAAGGRNSIKTTATQQRLALIEFVGNSDDPQRHHSLSTRASSSAHLAHQQQQHHQQHHPQRHQSLTLWCSDRETAKLLCKQIMRAKALFDRRATGGKVLQRNAKKLQPIFTI